MDNETLYKWPCRAELLSNRREAVIERSFKTVTIESSQKSAFVRSVRLWSVNQWTMEAEEVTDLWIRTQSVIVEEKMLMVGEGMERVTDCELF
jgi:hypothetical protein